MRPYKESIIELHVKHEGRWHLVCEWLIMADCSSYQGLWNNVLRAPLAEFAPQAIKRCHSMSFVRQPRCRAFCSNIDQYWYGVAIASSMSSRHYGISTFHTLLHLSCPMLDEVPCRACHQRVFGDKVGT